MGIPQKEDMGPIEIIEAAAKGAAKFASKHTTLTVLGGAAALGGGIVAYNNSGEADRAASGGAFMKQDVAVKDKRGDLSLKVQGVKDAATPKANEPAKSEAKSGNDEILKKLHEATEDAGIMAETEKVQEVPEPEKPYIPEQMEENKTSTNVLDGNGSNVFRPARFASSGSGSTAYEQSEGGQSFGATTSENASNGPTVKVAKSGGKVEELEGKTPATSASGKAETAKTGGDKGGETGNKGGETGNKGGETGKNQGGDGSTTETGKGTLSDNNNSSESKVETAKSPSDGGEPLSGETTVVTTTTAVDDTVSKVAKTTEPKPELEKRKDNTVSTVDDPTKQQRLEELKKKYLSRERVYDAVKAEEEKKREAEEKQRQLREEKRKALRLQYLQDLENALEKEAGCDVDAVVSPSERKRAGITSSEVMLLKRNAYLRVLKNAFKKEDDCDVDDVVAPSERERAGITSIEVMQLAARSDMRTKKVTLYVDDTSVTFIYLIPQLEALGERTESERNPNLYFLLQNGSRFLSRFLDGSEKIKGISLYPDKSGKVWVYFDKDPVDPSDKKKPDAGETKEETIGETAKKTESGLTKAGAGATGSGGATTSSTSGANGRKEGNFVKSSPMGV